MHSNDSRIPRENSSELLTPFAIEQLYDKYSTEIHPNERKCLTDTARKIINSELPSLANLKILVNLHITTITLILIDLLRVAGATVSVTATENLVVHADALAAIKRAAKNKKNKLEWITHQSPNQTLAIVLSTRKNDFDITIDCGGGLLGLVVPKIRGVELTHTDRSLYQDITYPIVNVNDSQLKKIETRYGTGNAVCRLFQEVFPKLVSYNALHSALTVAADVARREGHFQTGTELQHQANRSWFDATHKFVIIGGGQVGMGIAHALQSAYTYDAITPDGSVKTVTGVAKQNITIVDNNRSALSFAKFEGYNTCPIEPKDLNNEQSYLIDRIARLNDEVSKLNTSLEHDSIINAKKVALLGELESLNIRLDQITNIQAKHLQDIKNLFREAYCVITATGVAGCMSKHFTPADFHPNCILINMGTPDEWGSHFPSTRILNDKKPANFLMSKPTEVHFLDPIFTALFYGCLCPLALQETRGLIPLPKQIDDHIITLFKINYPHINIFDALNRVILSRHSNSPRLSILDSDTNNGNSRDSSQNSETILTDESSHGSSDSTYPLDSASNSSTPLGSSPPDMDPQDPAADLQSLSIAAAAAAASSSLPYRGIPRSAPSSPNKSSISKRKIDSDAAPQPNLTSVKAFACVFDSTYPDTLFNPSSNSKPRVVRKLDFSGSPPSAHTSIFDRPVQKP